MVPLTIEQEKAGGVEVDENAADGAIGHGNITYNPNTRVLSYSFELRELSSDITSLHFHGPARRLEGGILQVSFGNANNQSV